MKQDNSRPSSSEFSREFKPEDLQLHAFAQNAHKTYRSRERVARCLAPCCGGKIRPIHSPKSSDWSEFASPEVTTSPRAVTANLMNPGKGSKHAFKFAKRLRIARAPISASSVSGHLHTCSCCQEEAPIQQTEIAPLPCLDSCCSDLQQPVQKLSTGCSCCDAENENEPKTRWLTEKARFIGGAVGLLLLLLLPMTHTVKGAIATVLVAWVGYPVFAAAFRSIRRGKGLDETVLMSVASLGALALAWFAGMDDFIEALVVVWLYQIGEALEHRAGGKSQQQIQKLLDLRPTVVHVQASDGGWVDRDPVHVKPGTAFVVRAGEQIPLDGLVLVGESSLDVRALTGESLPLAVRPGSKVNSGSVNGDGVLHIKSTKTYKDSTVSRILALASAAETRKANLETSVRRWAKFYTPLVVALAVLLAVGGPLLTWMTGGSLAWETWLYRGLTILVVSCPCAWIIAIPLTNFAALGAAAQMGILIRGSRPLEAWARLKTVVWDKTGTLSAGELQVQSVTTVRGTREQLLDKAACVEWASTHPIAAAVRLASGKTPDPKRVFGVQENRGYGIQAQVDGKIVRVGSQRYFEQLGIDCREVPEHKGVSVLLVGEEQSLLGWITLSDPLRKESAETIRSLRNLGVEKQILLSGDKGDVVARVGMALGLDEVYGEQLPDQKVEIVQAQLAKQSQGEALGYVGDGMNDVPVLRMADLGIAMGGLGSDAALEAADVVLLREDLSLLPRGYRLASRAQRIVRQNLIGVLVVKITVLVAASAGLASLDWAIFSDVGMLLLAIGNALRARRIPS